LYHFLGPTLQKAKPFRIEGADDWRLEGGDFRRFEDWLGRDWVWKLPNFKGFLKTLEGALGKKRHWLRPV